MTRGDIAELEDRVAHLETTVAENSRRLRLHARIGWTLFILWLIGQTVAVVVILRFLFG